MNRILQNFTDDILRTKFYGILRTEFYEQNFTDGHFMKKILWNFTDEILQICRDEILRNFTDGICLRSFNTFWKLRLVVATSHEIQTKMNLFQAEKRVELPSASGRTHRHCLRAAASAAAAAAADAAAAAACGRTHAASPTRCCSAPGQCRGSIPGQTAQLDCRRSPRSLQGLCQYYRLLRQLSVDASNSATAYER